MNKKSLLLFGILGGVLALVSLTLVNTGTGHVKVVEVVEVLQEENATLTKANESLTNQNNKLKTTADSLVVAKDSLDKAVESLSLEVNAYEIKSQKTVKVNDVKPSGVVDQPYNILVPIEAEETEVSSYKD